MKTYWNVSVYVRDCIKVSTGDVKLTDALSQAISMCVYYQTIYPGEPVSIREIHESCSRCHNCGEVTVRSPRSQRVVRCPECKGKLAQGRIDTIEFKMPDSANCIRLVQDLSQKESA